MRCAVLNRAYRGQGRAQGEGQASALRYRETLLSNSGQNLQVDWAIGTDASALANRFKKRDCDVDFDYQISFL